MGGRLLKAARSALSARFSSNPSKGSRYAARLMLVVGGLSIGDRYAVCAKGDRYAVCAKL